MLGVCNCTAVGSMLSKATRKTTSVRGSTWRTHGGNEDMYVNSRKKTLQRKTYTQNVSTTPHPSYSLTQSNAEITRTHTSTNARRNIQDRGVSHAFIGALKGMRKFEKRKYQGREVNEDARFLDMDHNYTRP